MTKKGQSRRQPYAKQTARPPKEKSEIKLHAKAPVRKKTSAAIKQSPQAEPFESAQPVRQIPWWFTPEHHRTLGPGGGLPGTLLPPGLPGAPGLGTGTGSLTPGLGTFPPGTGSFPPGTGTLTPGAGSFPPGTGTLTPGTGSFPPGTGALTPGAGSIPPGTGTLTPGAGSFPFGTGALTPGTGGAPLGTGSFPFGPRPRPPVPMAAAVSGQAPSPQTASFVGVAVDGGLAYPNIAGTSYVTFHPGMTLRQALYASGRVHFGPNGFITGVAGFSIGGPTGLTVRYNGRVIPQTLLDQPITPGSTITLSLFHL